LCIRLLYRLAHFHGRRGGRSPSLARQTSVKRPDFTHPHPRASRPSPFSPPPCSWETWLNDTSKHGAGADESAARTSAAHKTFHGLGDDEKSRLIFATARYLAMAAHANGGLVTEAKLREAVLKDYPTKVSVAVLLEEAALPLAKVWGYEVVPAVKTLTEGA
jgi:hypothetical protein